MTTPTVGVLFVCLGNICRSPLAKFVFTDLAAKQGVLHRFRIDSCGTGPWHVGHPADPRTIAVATHHGLDPTHTARMFDPVLDPQRFDHILVMDRHNLRTLERMGVPAGKARLLRLFSDPGVRGNDDEVPDPYEEGHEAFAKVHNILVHSCSGLLVDLLEDVP